MKQVERPSQQARKGPLEFGSNDRFGSKDRKDRWGRSRDAIRSGPACPDRCRYAAAPDTSSIPAVLTAQAIPRARPPE
jgi:hypothetical protein